jgi:hypothetical protein
MKILITVKSPLKRKSFLTDEEWIVPDNIVTLKDLLCELTGQMVYRYQNKKIDIDIVNALTEEQISDAVESGKVDFGRRIGAGEVTEDKAVETMLLAFEDGLFRVFKNDRELTSQGENIYLQDGDRIMIVRFIMLSGSFLPYLY